MVFVNSPIITNSTANRIAKELNSNKKNYLKFIESHKKNIESLRIELGDIEYSYFHECDNVCIHHGLLLPIERSLIEAYFKQPDGSSVIVATATLAQGINLPAEVIIIAGDDRYDETTNSRESINAHELLNIAGIAGRGGLSSQGAVILIPGDIITIDDCDISRKWWNLKEEVFSKGDQCLNIEDPLEYFLDTLETDSTAVSPDQINILYRFIILYL